MIDPKLISKDPGMVRASLLKRGKPDLLEHVQNLVALNESRSSLISVIDKNRAQHKKLSDAVGQAYRSGDREEGGRIREEAIALNEQTEHFEAQLKKVEQDRLDLSMQLPNLLDDTVPEGTSEADNKPLATGGILPTFKFEPQSHVEIGTRLGILDFERAAKIAGSRFWILKGKGAKLERALITFFLDQAEASGHTEVLTPYIAHRAMLEGTGQLPKFENDLFKIEGQLNGSDAFLIPTGEVPITNLHRDEILEDLFTPLRYVGFTPCFRAEAGTHGKDVRGLIRVHQFHKVEMVWITTPEWSDGCLELMTSMAEKLLFMLDLPFRKVLLCGGDTGFSAAKTYDLEVWLPSQNAYREISSVSNFRDFQARRMGLRYRVEGQKKPQLCHTLNGSALAVGRTLVAILENGQQADGSVVLPDALVPYMGTKVLEP